MENKKRHKGFILHVIGFLLNLFVILMVVGWAWVNISEFMDKELDVHFAKIESNAIVSHFKNNRVIVTKGNSYKLILEPALIIGNTKIEFEKSFPWHNFRLKETYVEGTSPNIYYLLWKPYEEDEVKVIIKTTAGADWEETMHELTIVVQ